MNFIRLGVLGTLFTVLMSLYTWSQEAWSRHITTREGLPSMQVYDIFQDKNGLLWFATDRGIASYDGYDFKVYGIEDGLTDLTIFKFFEQPDGRIWCSTFNNQIFYFHPDDIRFRPYKYNNAIVRRNIGDVIDEILCFRDGSVMLTYSISAGFTYINAEGKGSDLRGKDFGIFELGDTLLVQLREREGRVYSFFGMKGNDLLKKKIVKDKIVSSQVHVTKEDSRVDAEQLGDFSVIGLYNNVYFKEGEQLLWSKRYQNQIISVGAYLDSMLYVSLRNEGVYIYDFQGHLIDHLLEGKSVTCLKADHEEGVWVATLSSGLYYFRNPRIKRYVGIGSNHIFRLGKSVDGALFAAFYHAETFCLESDGTWRPLFDSERKIRFKKWGDRSKVEILPPSKTVLRLTHPVSDGENLRELEWYSTFIAKVGGIYFRLSAGHFYDVNERSYLKGELDYRTDVFNRRINDLYWSNGRLEIATLDGLFYYDLKGEKGVRKYADRELNVRINDIEKIGDDFVFASTNGLLRRSKNGSIRRFGRKEGLSSDVINQIVVEGDSLLFICTNNGVNIMRINGRAWKIDKMMLLRGEDVEDLEVLDKYIYVGSRTGLYRLKKSELNDRGNPPNYFFRIQDIMINGVHKSRKELLNLAFNENKLEIRFRGISFDPDRKIWYRYRLKELENEWNYTQSTSLIYPSIAPGSYQLLFELSLDGERWTAVQGSAQVNISPPYYSTWWFRLMVIVVMIVIVYLFFKIRVLTYNRDVVRELIRIVIRKLKKKDRYIVVRSSGKDVKIPTHEIQYVLSADNYIEIYTKEKRYATRERISHFMEMVPDPLEFIRIHRTCIVRIDQVTAKTPNSLFVGDREFSVSATYHKELQRLEL
ncbi:MAG: hypothetical protein EP338_04700 [Bacteroidetes bacterium]|nr:MAG: hypothetical protein EP338_04700 [Bacteroidota bacterium]